MRRLFRFGPERNTVGELVPTLAEQGDLQNLLNSGRRLAVSLDQANPVWTHGPNNVDRYELHINDECTLMIPAD